MIRRSMIAQGADAGEDLTFDQTPVAIRSAECEVALGEETATG